MQKHLSNFQKILTNLLSTSEKVEEKTRELIFLSSLLLFFESLVTAFLEEKSTIKMNEVTSALLQNKILKYENRASSSGSDSALTMTEGGSGKGQSSRGSQGG